MNTKFNKLMKTLEDCNDTKVENEQGIVTEVGTTIAVDIAGDTSITYGYDDALIHLYSRNKEILSFGEDSPLIDMFSEIVELINESEADVKMAKKYRTQSEKLPTERTSTAMIYETLGFRFVKDETFPWIDVYKFDTNGKPIYLEEFEPEETIVEFTVLKVVAMNWIHENVDIELQG